MSTQSRDTEPEFERIQIARLRELSFAHKFAAIRTGAEALAYANLQTTDDPRSLSEQERAGRFVARQYGAVLAADVVAAVRQQPSWSLGRFDLVPALLQVTEALTGLGSRYALIGQLACALYGFPRPVFTVALLADVPPERLAAFAAQLHPDTLIRDVRVRAGTDEAEATETTKATTEATDAYEEVLIQGRTPTRLAGQVERLERTWSGAPMPSLPRMPRWHLVHLSTLVGVEVVPVGPKSTFAHQTLQRARSLALGDDGTWLVRVATPEDVVLLDLLDLQRPVRRARQGNDPRASGASGASGASEASEASEWDDDRWNDLRGVLKVQAPTLDLDLLDREAVQIGVCEVLRHALADVGLLGPPDRPGPLPGPTSGNGQSIGH